MFRFVFNATCELCLNVCFNVFNAFRVFKNLFTSSRSGRRRQQHSGFESCLRGNFTVALNSPKIVQSSGATALSLSNAMRSVGVIVFTHVAFCSANAKKQCLSQTGAISAALVVSGGLLYAYQTSIATTTSGGVPAKRSAAPPPSASAKPTRASARLAIASAEKSKSARTTLRRRR